MARSLGRASGRSTHRPRPESGTPAGPSAWGDAVSSCPWRRPGMPRRLRRGVQEQPVRERRAHQHREGRLEAALRCRRGNRIRERRVREARADPEVADHPDDGRAGRDRPRAHRRRRGCREFRAGVQPPEQRAGDKQSLVDHQRALDDLRKSLNEPGDKSRNFDPNFEAGQAPEREARPHRVARDASLRALAKERHRLVSMTTASQIVGCSERTISRAARRARSSSGAWRRRRSRRLTGSRSKPSAGQGSGSNPLAAGADVVECAA